MNVRARHLANPVSKEEITFLQTGADSDGELFAFEVVTPPDMVPPPAHVHVREEERIEVLEGEITTRVGGREAVLHAGDTAVWDAGVAHTWWNSGPGELRFRAEFRPAGTMQSFFETYCGLASEGRCDDQGQPPLLQVAASLPLWGMYLDGSPVLAQRVLMALLRPIAWSRGYRARYERFEEFEPGLVTSDSCADIAVRVERRERREMPVDRRALQSPMASSQDSRGSRSPRRSATAVSAGPRRGWPLDVPPAVAGRSGVADALDSPPSPTPTCGCCGRHGRRLAELGATPGVFICRLCALWAWRRAVRP